MFPRATQIKTYSWDNAQVVLIGNKLDLEDDRQVPAEDAQRLATELGQLTQVVNRNKPNFHHSHLILRFSLSLGFQFFEASAKDNINVKQVFDKLVDVICEKMTESVNGDVNSPAIHKGDGLKDTPHSSQGACAC